MVKDIYPDDYGSSPFDLSKYGNNVMSFAMAKKVKPYLQLEQTQRNGF